MGESREGSGSVSARLVGLFAVALLALTGCGGEQPEVPAPAAVESSDPSDAKPRRKRAEPLEPVRCPPELSNCAEASGRVVYVERVDPDGDGDAHFVLASKDSITGPGISVIDVRKDLRPRPLPSIGDQIAAAGPVYRGSYGQRQIEAIAINVRRN